MFFLVFCLFLFSLVDNFSQHLEKDQSRWNANNHQVAQLRQIAICCDNVIN